MHSCCKLLIPSAIEIREMSRKTIAILVLVASFVLIILNIIFTRDEMGVGFWLRIGSSALLIAAMILTLKAQNQG